MVSASFQAKSLSLKNYYDLLTQMFLAVNKIIGHVPYAVFDKTNGPVALPVAANPVLARPLASISFFLSFFHIIKFYLE